MCTLLISLQIGGLSFLLCRRLSIPMLYQEYWEWFFRLKEEGQLGRLARLSNALVHIGWHTRKGLV